MLKKISPFPSAICHYTMGSLINGPQTVNRKQRHDPPEKINTQIPNPPKKIVQFSIRIVDKITLRRIK